MSTTEAAIALHPVLERAHATAREARLPHAGSVTPDEAWALAQGGDAVIVDVRSAEERTFVGHVPGTLHVAWASGTALTRNPRFVRELQAKVGKERAVLLLCRSGKRSTLAAEAAAAAGLANVFNISEGFEGALDDAGHRGTSEGWRFRGLPWVQA